MSTMQIHILTLFPDAFPGSLSLSIIGKAIRNNLVKIHVYDLKEIATEIDDTPYGGGSGMVMRPEIIHNAIIKHNLQDTYKIYLSPRGHVFNQATAQAMSVMPRDILILCGRYEGVDQRALDHWNFHELSLGNFVLCGGEVAALAILEACIRLIPDVVGNKTSLEHESFENALLEHNQYTKPEIWKVDDLEYRVPEELLTGHHQQIQAYRKAQSLIITHEKDMLTEK